jgi:hypothetical protein
MEFRDAGLEWTEVPWPEFQNGSAEAPVRWDIERVKPLGRGEFRDVRRGVCGGELGPRMRPSLWVGSERRRLRK